MPMPRLDPGNPESPQVTAIVTTEMRNQVIELAAERGVSKSTATRLLIERGIEALDAEADTE
jgi:hypothetical protein